MRGVSSASLSCAPDIPPSATHDCKVFSIFMAMKIENNVNQGKITEAADEFLKWNKVKKSDTYVESAGLTKRRKQERAVFLYHLQARN